MIITVTLNPAMDKTIMVDNFKIGEVNRISSIRHDVGGKGINVSKVLSNFNIKSISTGFIGGTWENDFVKELNLRNIECKFTNIKGNTRTNVKIVDNINKTYTDVNESGPEILEEEMQSFINNFKILCNADDIVVLSGGVSPSISTDIYYTLINIAKSKGALTILDADGDLLKEGLKAKPHIIKPNNHELRKLFNLNSDSEEEIIKAGKKLLEDGIKEVLISLGEKGAIHITENGIYCCGGLKVSVKSTVGAGDSMVAALVYSKLNNYDDIETLKFATACGAASVMLEGTEACSIGQVNGLLHKINVKKHKSL